MLLPLLDTLGKNMFKLLVVVSKRLPALTNTGIITIMHREKGYDHSSCNMTYILTSNTIWIVTKVLSDSDYTCMIDRRDLNEITHWTSAKVYGKEISSSCHVSV